MTIENRTAAHARSTSIIMRDGADLNGPRRITDEAATVCVRAFPFAAIATQVASGDLCIGATYALVNHGLCRGYVGSAGELDSRLKQHAADPEKAFATEVFAVCGAGTNLDYEAAVCMERLLKHAIERAGVAQLVNRVEPRAARLSASRLISIERKFADAQALLYDAGLHWLVPHPVSTAAVPAEAGSAEEPPPLAPDAEVAAADEQADEEADEGPMEIGVTVVPLGVEEQRLAFSDLWARGYQYGHRFIVAAGSQMRGEANPSANQHTRDRRERLIKAGAAKNVEGTDDRYRLDVAVAFPSRAIAAKVLAGAHVGSEKWRPLAAGRPCLIAR